MKTLSNVFVLGMALLLPIVQLHAAEVGVQSAMNQLNSDLRVVNSKESFASAQKNFLGSISSLEGAAREEALKELKNALPVEGQVKVDALVESIQSGVLTKDEINARVVEIAKSSQIKGAAWDSTPALIIGGAVLVILAVVLIAASSGGSVSVDYYDPYYYDPYYYDPYCYYDYYYGYICY